MIGNGSSILWNMSATDDNSAAIVTALLKKLLKTTNKSDSLKTRLTVDKKKLKSFFLDFFVGSYSH